MSVSKARSHGGRGRPALLCTTEAEADAVLRLIEEVREQVRRGTWSACLATNGLDWCQSVEWEEAMGGRSHAAGSETECPVCRLRTLLGEITSESEKT